MPLHGLAPYYTFELETQTDTTICFSLSANEETLSYYPFNFTFKVHFSLEGKKLDISYEVINNDDKEMVYFIGAHPGFLLNWYEGDSIENYQLEFSEKETADRRRVDMDLLALDTKFEKDFLFLGGVNLKSIYKTQIL